MFPIPWNRAFRKKDGTLSTIGHEIENGGGSYTLPTASGETKGGVKIGSRLTMNGEVLSADAQVPTHTSAEAGKVLTVDENGDLEWDTKGSGGGDAYVSYDFTKFGTRSAYNVSFSSDGARFSNGGNALIPIIGLVSNYQTPAYSDISIFVDTGLLSLTSGAHRRFIMISNDTGLIYRSTGVWSLYLTSWADSAITDVTFFDNCTVKVYIDSNRHWHIYKDGVLVFKDTTMASSVTSVQIGSTGSSLINSNIKACRVYNGNYTET